MYAEYSKLNLRVVLLLIAQIAMLLTYFTAYSQSQIQAAFFASVFVGGILAGVISWTTTLAWKYFFRKCIAIFVLFCIFSVCFSAIPSMKLSATIAELEFYESKQWSRMPPGAIHAAIYGPIAMFASSLGILASIPMWWLTSITQTPDPD